MFQFAQKNEKNAKISYLREISRNFVSQNFFVLAKIFVYAKVFAKTKYLKKFDSDTACMMNACCVIFYITLHFGRIIRTYCMCSYVRIQLPLRLKQKSSYFREHVRKNFFTKINKNNGNINDSDYMGNGAYD
jgi:hypothetical protein